MSEHGSGSESHATGSTKTFTIVWIWLAAITFLEVFLAYERLQPALMLTVLIVLSVVKAALIISYFMHMKYEKTSFALFLIPSAIFCICMAMIFFLPDSWRLLQTRLPH